jgi:hypothetical protein
MLDSWRALRARRYNQTHYDHDNPPPKVVQGYKFNIFFPDLITKDEAPVYSLEKARVYISVSDTLEEERGHACWRRNQVCAWLGIAMQFLCSRAGMLGTARRSEAAAG